MIKTYKRTIELAGDPVLDSIVDGPGLRLVLFVQGCPHKCPGCHNPESWNVGEGIEYELSKIVKTMHEYRNFYQGITFSGGEPFQDRHIPQLVYLAKEAHKLGWNVWAYTGFLFEGLVVDKKKSAFVKQVDVLIDGPFVREMRTLSLPWQGSTNQRIIDVQQSLKRKTTVLYKD